MHNLISVVLASLLCSLPVWAASKSSNINIEITKAYSVPSSKAEDFAIADKREDDSVFAGIFDGHGSKTVADKMSELFLARLTEGPLSDREIAQEFFATAQGIAVESLVGADAVVGRGGSTATVVDVSRDTIRASWVGDSEAYLFMPGDFEFRGEKYNGFTSQPFSATESYVQIAGDHSPDNLYEKQWMEMQGAKLDIMYDCQRGYTKRPYWSGDKRIELDHQRYGLYIKNVRSDWATVVCSRFGPNIIAMTRSLGDIKLHDSGLISIPSYSEIAVPSNFSGKAYIVVASDGVWDVWKLEEMRSFLYGVEGDTNSKAEALMAETSTLSRKLFGSSADDMTLIVIALSYSSDGALIQEGKSL